MDHVAVAKIRRQLEAANMIALNEQHPVRRDTSQSCVQVCAGQTEDLTGCSWSELQIYLSQQMQEGETWEDYGKKFVIDHIKPLAAFDLTDPEEYRQSYHFTNLQLLTVAENSSKGSLLPDGTRAKYKR